MKQELGQRLRRLRIERNLELSTLAMRLDSIADSVRAIENGEKHPTPAYIEKICEALELSPNETSEVLVLADTSGKKQNSTILDSSISSFKLKGNPYKGLSAFREEDADIFFGRDLIVERIINAIYRLSLICVVGASGSGKSSLISAGVIPKLRDKWKAIKLRPGSNPFQNLSSILAPILEPNLSRIEILSEIPKLSKTLQEIKSPIFIHQIFDEYASADGFLMFIDQFEEIFTQTTQNEREDFLEFLINFSKVTTAERHSCLVLTIRADFFGQLISLPNFSQYLQDGIVLVPPMSSSELVDAIVKPAEQRDGYFEVDLIQRLISDTGNQSATLPLLQFCLAWMWENSKNGSLKHSDYDDIGGLSGALAQKANELLTGYTQEDEYQIKKLMLSLVNVAEPGLGESDTKRRLFMNEIDPNPRLLEIIEKFISNRLLVSDWDFTNNCQYIEFTHEAVINNWNRLATWIATDREFLSWIAQMRGAENIWATSNQDPSFLLHSKQLRQAIEWLELKGEEKIEMRIITFINESIKLQKQEESILREKRIEILLTIQLDDFSSILQEIHSDTSQLMQEALRNRLSTTSVIDEEWRLRIALLKTDTEQASPLVTLSEKLDIKALRIIKEKILSSFSLIAEDLRKIVNNPDASNAIVSKLTYISPEFFLEKLLENSSSVLPEKIISFLLGESPSDLDIWMTSFSIIQLRLLPLLRKEINKSTRDQKFFNSILLLKRIAQSTPELFAEISTEVPREYFNDFSDLLSESSLNHQEIANSLIHILQASNSKGDTTDEQLSLFRGKKKACAAILLSRINRVSSALQVLKFDRDPESSTQFIIESILRGVDKKILLQGFNLAKTSQEYAGFVQMLSSISKDDQDTFYPYILELINQTKSSSVRASCEWLLGCWEANQEILEIKRKDSAKGILSDREWFTIEVPWGEYLTFVQFSPGIFLMGIQNEEDSHTYLDSKIIQRVEITKPFAVADREVTRKAFEVFIQETNIKDFPKITHVSPEEDTPIVAITWDEANQFCSWLSEKVTIPITASSQPILKNIKFRLPTEAEWEYFARSLTVTRFSFGRDNNLIKYFAWCAENSNEVVHSGGSLLPNPRGLFNIHGNCWEWCSDWFDEYCESKLIIDPAGPLNGETRVLRGGCWNLGPKWSRSACRNTHKVSNRNYYTSFRLVADFV